MPSKAKVLQGLTEQEQVTVPIRGMLIMLHFLSLNCVITTQTDQKDKVVMIPRPIGLSPSSVVHRPD